MLSSLQEYGVRCLLQLARRPGGGPLTAREIAEAQRRAREWLSASSRRAA